MGDQDDPDIELFREPAEDADEDDVPARPLPERTPPPGFSPRPRPLRVIAVSGAKGGVGKTLITANLALYLATIGRRVVVVDADAVGANLHTFLGLPRPTKIGTYVPPAHPFPSYREAPPAAAAAEEAPAAPTEPGLMETSIPGLSLLHAGIDEPAEGTTRRGRREQLMERLRSLQAEYVVVDLGQATDRSLLDLWLGSDLAVFVSQPEPTAIENTYRFIRYAFARHLRAAAPDADTRHHLIERMRALGNAPPPLDLVRALDKDGDALAGFVRDQLDAFSFRLVLSQTRLRADLDLGDRMRTVVWRRLAVQLDYLGYVDHDDTVWSCVRIRRPLLVESPGTKASRSIEKIARRILAIDTGKDSGSEQMRTTPPESHHDLLEVDRGANDEEIRRAYKRAREIYAPEALCCYGLFDPEGVEALRARLDEAYDVLLDPARRRPYELSVFPSAPLPDPGPVVDGDEQPAPPPPVITPDTEFTGALIRAVRESQRVALREVSQRTKIGVGHLRAIEEDRFGELPAAVYVRGFVSELAKVLRLDPDQVSRTYVRRYRRFLEEQEKV